MFQFLCTVLSMSPSYSQGSHRKMPPPKRSAFRVSDKGFDKCVLSVFLPFLSNCLFPLPSKFAHPALTAISIPFYTAFHPLFILLIPHFICWLTHSLASPVSLSLALCSPQALPLLERLSLSPLQGKPPLLLPPLDNENGAHFLKSALLVQKPCAHG